MAELSIPEHFILKDVQDQGVHLGDGAYGRVFEVQYAGLRCAAKEIHSIYFRVARPIELKKIKTDFLREYHIWSTLHHPKIVTLIGVYFRDCDNSGIPIMVMEKMQRTLRSLIERREDGEMDVQIDLSVKLSILHDISVGLWYLHVHNPSIIHRDLTPNNILLRQGTHGFEAKISDLGVSKVMKNNDSGSKMTRIPGTPDFMPPETFDDNPKYDTAVDIFSYAAVILYTFVEQWPEPKAREKVNIVGKRELVPEVERRQEYISNMKEFAAKLKPLVISCLDDNPKGRPLISKVSTAIEKFKEESHTYSASLEVSFKISIVINKGVTH